MNSRGKIDTQQLVQFQSHRSTMLVKLVTLLSVALLMLTSYRLWLPTSSTSFPQIPMTGLLTSVPFWVDYPAVLLFTILILVQFIAIARARLHSSTAGHAIGSSEFQPPSRSRIEHTLWWLLLGTSFFLVSLNQHRLQSWYFHFIIFSLAFTIHSAPRQLIWLKRFSVGVYIYSAIGKIDFEFVHTVGQDFLIALAKLLHFSVDSWSENDRIVTALLFPLVELTIGVGLLFRRSCRVAGVAAFLFHLLLATLVAGPLKHSWGVFLWNLQFAVQAIVLFVLPSQPLSIFFRSMNDSREIEKAVSNRNGDRLTALEYLATTLIAATLVMPITERSGFWDHWPSWALYAPHSSRVRVTVAGFAVKQLPSSLRELISEENLERPEVELPLARWSFQQLGVPIYPQARFQLGVARGLAARIESELGIQVEVRSAADRFTGERKTTKLHGVHEIRQGFNRFWLCSQPRH